MNAPARPEAGQRKLAYLALGSNLGDREANLARARGELDRRGARLLRSSSIEETEPWGVAEQPPFLNQVLEVEWQGTPRQLLEAAQQVEAAVGRKPSYRWGPREIDVDLLLVGESRLDEPDLQLPHPRLREREFVLRELAELRADLVAGLQ